MTSTRLLRGDDDDDDDDDDGDDDDITMRKNQRVHIGRYQNLRLVFLCVPSV